MLFKVKFHDGIRQGTITLAFRHWESPRVKTGGRYRFGARHDREDFLIVDAVDTVVPRRIQLSDAREAGYASRAALLNELARYASETSNIFRVRFHYDSDQTDVRDVLREDLAAEHLDDVLAKLRRMDRNGPWTHAVLNLIAASPRVAASRLAPQLGRELLPFKTDVRKLKALGLTISHEVGYELSPRGHAIVARLDADQVPKPADNATARRAARPRS